jgi:Skp family chaperone for outer membrane proteins
MKKFVVRSALALSMVGALGLATAGVASAGKATTHSSRATVSRHTYREEMASYRASRQAIEATFRAAVASARSNYLQAIESATTSAERSAAQQAMQAAIIQAAGVRSASLVTLGAPPTPPSL